jgi:hypothetical protein
MKNKLGLILLVSFVILFFISFTSAELIRGDGNLGNVHNWFWQIFERLKELVGAIGNTPLEFATFNLTAYGNNLFINDGVDINITPYYDNETPLTVENFTWIIKELDNHQTGEFGINLTNPPENPFDVFYFKTNLLEKVKNCVVVNQYFTQCEKYELDFSNILTKNSEYNATYNISAIYETDEYGFNKIIGYWINLFNVLDLDPAVIFSYLNSQTNGYYNRTEGSNLGARLLASVLFMNFNQENQSSVVADNSVYSNNGAINGNVIWNSTGGYDGSGAYTFNGTNYITSTVTQSKTTITFWYKNSTATSWTHIVNASGTTYVNGIASIPSEYPIYISGNSVNIGGYASAGSCIGSPIFGCIEFNDGGWNGSACHNSAYNGDDHAWQCSYEDLTGGCTDVPSLSCEAQTACAETYGDGCCTQITGCSMSAGVTISFNGSIDNVLILDKTLTSAEVLNLYNGTINNSKYIGSFFNQGDFESLVFYNSTNSTYWNVNLGITYKNYTNGTVTANGQNITLQTRTANSYNISDPSLVGFWSFNNDNSTTVFDELGKNNGTRQGAIANATEGNGTVGKGYSFNKTSYITLANNGTANGFDNQNITISMWYHTPAAFTNYYQGMLYSNDKPAPWGEPYYANHIRVGDGSSNIARLYWAWNDGSNFHNIMSSVDVPVNSWVHVVVIYTKGRQEIWQNGVLVASDNRNDTIKFFGQPVWLGKSAISIQDYTSGSYAIDEVRIYNRTISTSEIQNLYELGNYHISNWDAWSSATLVSNGLPVTSSSSGKFMQFKANFNTNDTAISPYLLEHNVTAGEIGGTQGIPPNATNFSNYDTTNFSAVVDLNNVSNMTLANANDKIVWNNAVNASGQDFDNNIIFGDGFVSLNISALNQNINSSANITINNVICPAIIYYGTGVYSSASGILNERTICTDCSIISCIGGNNGNLTFSVSHFTGYAGIGDANLTIWDQNDSGMPYGNQPAAINTQIKFFANYTNNTINISGASCNICFNDTGACSSMNENSSISLYDYNRTFSSVGTYTWNVTCNKTGYETLNASDNIVIISQPLFAGGDGTIGDPYQIASWTYLNNTKLNLTAYYILTANLSSSTPGYAGIGNNWTPIGDNVNKFTGNFNGNNNTISNLTINLPATKYVGLFGSTKGNISNVGLINANISGSNYTGGLVGYQLDGTIDNSYSTGSIDASSYVGGLVGLSNGDFSNSYSTASVSGVSFVGGLSGNLNRIISNSYTTGSVAGSGNYVGGLVGSSVGIINNSYSIGNITGSGSVGGLVGIAGGTISNSYATGNVYSSSSYAGGLVGRQSYDGGTISNSYSIIDGAVSGADKVGALVGYTPLGSTITNSYAIVETSAIVNGSSSVGFIGFNNGTITDSYLTIRSVQFGNITFLDWNVTGTGNMLGNISIGNNSAYVNSAGQPGFNRSANIILLGLPTFANPKILRDGIVCDSTTSPSCYNFTSLNAGNVAFNVSSWTDYSIGEGETPTLPILIDNFTRTMLQILVGFITLSVLALSMTLIFKHIFYNFSTINVKEFVSYMVMIILGVSLAIVLINNVTNLL